MAAILKGVANQHRGDCKKAQESQPVHMGDGCSRPAGRQEGAAGLLKKPRGKRGLQPRDLGALRRGARILRAQQSTATSAGVFLVHRFLESAHMTAIPGRKGEAYNLVR